jgi:hypothetical protein
MVILSGASLHIQDVLMRENIKSSDSSLSFTPDYSSALTAAKALLSA